MPLYTQVNPDTMYNLAIDASLSEWKIVEEKGFTE
jgi:hypothetical protein